MSIPKLVSGRLTQLQTEERDWSHAIELEDSSVLFREPVAPQDRRIENDKATMNKSRRLEFGIERVLDNKSSIEANVVFRFGQRSRSRSDQSAV